MTTDLLSTHPNTPLAEAREVLLGHQHQIYPVIDEDGKLKGVINEETLRKSVQSEDESLVKDVMEKALGVVKPDETLLAVLKKIEIKRDPRVIVVDHERKLLGMASPTDFIRFRSRDDY